MIVPGSKLPEFSTQACVSIEKGKEFKKVSSKDFPGKWLVLYTYPKDFTFVCPDRNRGLRQEAERLRRP
ncbi:MAG: redoxin domain-containing protein [Polyangiaceae bacterium]